MEYSKLYIGLGSNLGDRKKNLENAKHAIQSKLGRIIRESPVYETEAVGKKDQPDFLNQVCVVVTSALDPDEIMQILLAIEKKMGRERKEKWGPRLIDLDLLYMDDLVYQSEIVTIPHPEIENRKFVLKPLNDLDADFNHPKLNKSNVQLLEDCSDDSVIVQLQT